MTHLQEWSCYVDEIDDEHVHLVMADKTSDRSDGHEIGSFPRHLLEHLNPGIGQYVTVVITDDKQIVIENTRVDDEDRARSASEVGQLLALLAQLREDGR